MSRPTVVRALELLKRDGWLESRQGYGTIVRDRPEVVEQKDRRGREALERDESPQLTGERVSGLSPEAGGWQAGRSRMSGPG
ncbi:DNA-binding GntR family transcriptional regulator [Streptomyces sp. B4I13]|nr:DNA-binding GntR family transcriptional regulator [Streptomyces sp. B4I13]